MKQQVLFFFFTLMLTGISVSAQTGGGRIAGVVIDNAGEEPLPGATIFIEELKKGIVTDGHGEFLLSDVPAADAKDGFHGGAIEKITVFGNSKI